MECHQNKLSGNVRWMHCYCFVQSSDVFFDRNAQYQSSLFISVTKGLYSSIQLPRYLRYLSCLGTYKRAFSSNCELGLNECNLLFLIIWLHLFPKMLFQRYKVSKLNCAYLRFRSVIDFFSQNTSLNVLHHHTTTSDHTTTSSR